MDYKLAMSVLNPKINSLEVDSPGSSSDGYTKTLDGILSPYDMERLRAYTKILTDSNLIYDICKTLGHQYFQESSRHHCHMFRHLYCYAWGCRSLNSLASR